MQNISRYKQKIRKTSNAIHPKINDINFFDFVDKYITEQSSDLHLHLNFRTKVHAKIMFIHKNHEDVIQLSTDHNGVPQLHACLTKHIASPNGVEWTKVKTDCKKV